MRRVKEASAGKIPTTLARRDLLVQLVQPLQRVLGPQPSSVLCWEGKVGEQIVLAVVHELAEL